jgi:hypothetical protein
MKAQSSTAISRQPFLATWVRIVLILALALPQAFFGAAPVAHAIDYVWTAYNDCSWQSGQTNPANTTTILGISGTGTLKNYDTGALLTEVYTDAEKLSTNTRVNTISYGAGTSVKDAGTNDRTCYNCGSSGGLVASINSNVISKAHISWQSADGAVAIKGHHPLIGRSIMDLCGVFSIEKFIQLCAGSQPGEISVDWLPCS